jgi:hypothetical protein
MAFGHRSHSSEARNIDFDGLLAVAMKTLICVFNWASGVLRTRQTLNIMAP